MSFGLSVGDISTTISITNELLKVDELRIPGQDSPIDILAHLKELLVRFRNAKPHNSSYQVQYNAFLEVSSQCQTALEQFRNCGRLQNKSNGGNWSVISRVEGPSTTWSPKVLTAFRAEITGHLLSLIMLDNLNSKLVPKNTQQSLATLDQFTLKNVQEMTAPVAQSICGFDNRNTLVDRTMKIISTNLRIYNAVVKLQLRGIPSQVKLRQPVVLNDALGRRAPFHLEYVTSHRVLNEILTLRFNNNDALQTYVRGGDYVLWSRNLQDTVDLDERWEDCFMPGDVVDMSIALQANKRCPMCGSKISLQANERVTCESCSTKYRRRQSQDQEKLIGPPTAKQAFDAPPPPEADILASPALQGFIIDFLSEAFTHFPEFSIWGPTSVKKWDLTQFYSKFSELIQELGAELFALATDEFQRQIARTIRRRHLAITKQVKTLSISQTPPGTDSPRRSNQANYLESRTNGRRSSLGSATESSSGSRTRHGFDLGKSEYIDEYRLDYPGLDKDKEAAVVFLTSGNALTNLGQKIRKSLYFDSDPHAKFWLVDQEMMEGFHTLYSFRDEEPDQRYTATFKVFWELWQFLKEELDGSKDLSPVITLSGSAVYARASQCAVYLQEHWGKLGLDLLNAIETALRSTDLRSGRYRPDGSLSTKTMDLLVEIHPSRSPDEKEQAVVRVYGSLDTLKQVGHCLTWLTAAIRISPYDQMSYSDAILTDHTYLAPFSADPEIRNSMYFEIYGQELQPLSREEQEMCWNPLFPHSVIADGFPIPKRENIPGLEISFDIMTNLSGVSYPVDHSGGIVLQGLSTMLVPTRLESEDSLQWHFMAKPRGSRMTLKDIDETCSEIYPAQDLSSLQSRRAFLGWSKEANIYLGTKEMNYAGMSFSRAMTPTPRMELSGLSVGLGSSIMGQGGPTAVANFTIGKRRRNEYSQQREEDFEFELRKTKDMPILLYDTSSRRAWLVPAISVILHLAHVYAHIFPSQVTLNNKRITLPYAEPSSDCGAAALKTILDNHALVISQSGITKQTRTFLGLIREIYFSLMLVVDKDSARAPASRTSIRRRAFLSGWELKAIVETPSFPQDKECPLLASSGGWFEVSSSVLVLFCDGLGEVIRPCEGGRRNFLCERWRGVPAGKDYLAASVGMLMVLSERCGFGDSCEMVGPGIMWERGDEVGEQGGVFADCRHGSGGGKCYRPLQKLRRVKTGRMFLRSRDRGRSRAGSRLGVMAASVTNTEAGRGGASPNGAVIFGKRSRGIPKLSVNITISRGSGDEAERAAWGLRSSSEVRDSRVTTSRGGEYSPGAVEFDSCSELDVYEIATLRDDDRDASDVRSGGTLIRVVESEFGNGVDPPPYRPGAIGEMAISDGLIYGKRNDGVDYNAIVVYGIRIRTAWVVGAVICYVIFVGLMNLRSVDSCGVWLRGMEDK
ncbi:hypothetical protein BKA65DRAFT_486888 [Rhexocercosporidium sp. MPI-PUGE-AT-0058]|nr:hypothetical protein BKA65DRAFT_486888 [Rhexocercosporidium sp. MPI-PUGE-AT-0058]